MIGAAIEISWGYVIGGVLILAIVQVAGGVASVVVATRVQARELQHVADHLSHQDRLLGKLFDRADASDRRCGEISEARIACETRAAGTFAARGELIRAMAETARATAASTGQAQEIRERITDLAREFAELRGRLAADGRVQT